MPGTRPTPSMRRSRQRRAAWDRKDSFSRRRSLSRDDFAGAVERMINHQRSKWGKAGYPGLRHREIEPLWAFVAPERA